MLSVGLPLSAVAVCNTVGADLEKVLHPFFDILCKKMTWIILIIIFALAIWALWKLKIPKCGNLILVTGGVKTGKSAMSVRLVEKIWKKNCFKVKLYNNFFRHFKKNKALKEMPLVYSNVPLGIPYVALTEDLIYRRKRFRYGSVIYACEASLVAGAMDFKNEDLNENLSLLMKLVGHETRGGSAILDTQAVLDLHYGMKRNLSTYFYIHHKINVPFFLILKVREMIFLEGSSNEFETDVEDTLKTVIVPKTVFKKYDCYCYSALTDHLPVEDTIAKPKDLKARSILTFKNNKKYYTVGENNE